MKMAAEHVEHLRAAIAPRDTAEMRDAYRTGQFPRADRCKDVDKRYRWDLLNATVPARWVCERYDEGLTDANVDTALRSIVKPL